MTPKEKYEQEQGFLETSPDEILEKIKEKINLDNLEIWIVEKISAILERNDINSAVGEISQIFDLTDKELEHLKKLPAEVIKKLFVKEKGEEGESGKIN